MHCVLGAMAFLSHALLILYMHLGDCTTDQQDHPVHHQPLLHEVSLSSRCEGGMTSLERAACTSYHTQNQGLDFTTHTSLCSSCPALKLMELLGRSHFD